MAAIKFDKILGRIRDADNPDTTTLQADITQIKTDITTIQNTLATHTHPTIPIQTIDTLFTTK